MDLKKYDEAAPETLSEARSFFRALCKGVTDASDKVLKIAGYLHERKIKEDAGSNDDFAGWIRLFRLASGWREDRPAAWCIMVLSFIYDMAGHPLGEALRDGQSEDGFASTSELMKYMKKAGVFFDAKEHEPLPADMIIMDLNRDFDKGGRVDHGGLCISYDEETGVMECYEGNFSNAFKKTKRKIDKRIIGYGSPIPEDD